jgi:hypothetical protein
VDKGSEGYKDKNKYYSYGWNNDIRNRVIKHGGNNPKYRIYTNWLSGRVGKIEYIIDLTLYMRY